MESIRQTQKKYCSRAITAAIFAGLVFILAGQEPIGKGLILGTIFSIINFIVMGEMLPLKIGKSKNKTFFLSLASIFSRYILLAIPLLIAVKFDQYNLISVVIGIFMVQFFILAEQVFINFSSNHKKQA
ncbi:MAG: ATP synthase subunit I [Desulfobacterales bacterium]|jgi:asparagine N-glycosylation enzyme membrane subunit Stt3